MQADGPASASGDELPPERTTETGERDERAPISHDARATDPDDLGGESPCLAHLLDEPYD